MTDMKKRYVHERSKPDGEAPTSRPGKDKTRRTKPRYVLGFLFDDDFKRVLLILKDHPDWQRGLFNGIGGHINKGEDPGDAMHREAMEEADVDADWSEYRVIKTNTYALHCFKASDTTSLLGAITLTNEMVGWYLLDNMPACVSFTREYINQALIDNE